VPVLDGQRQVIVGIKEAAVLIAQQTGLRDVAPADVRELARRGLVRVVVPGDWPLVSLDIAARLGLTAGMADELRLIVEGRQQWWAASLNRCDAAEALELTPAAFDALASHHGVEAGRFRRYARSDIERLRRLQFAPPPGVPRALAG
jgi:hypothetical protein